MTGSRYVFERAGRDVERERLAVLEALFDPATRRVLEESGLRSGWRCLELGAGGGSIARYLADRGASVLAVDLDARLLREHSHPEIEVLEGDLLEACFEPESFDLVHARYLLIHMAGYDRALDAILRALKPGGRLVLEEPDFSVARAAAGSREERRAFDRVQRAIEAMFRSRGMDSGFGFRLPDLLLDRGLVDLVVENEAPLVQGGSGIAEMMRLSALQLGEKYLATGAASEDDLAAYGRFVQDPGSWAVHYATVRARATRPATG